MTETSLAYHHLTGKHRYAIRPKFTHRKNGYGKSHRYYLYLDWHPALNLYGSVLHKIINVLHSANFHHQALPCIIMPACRPDNPTTRDRHLACTQNCARFALRMPALGGHITLLVFRGGGQSPTRKLRSNLRSRCRINSTTAARPSAATAAVMQPAGVPAHIASARWKRRLEGALEIAGARVCADRRMNV